MKRTKKTIPEGTIDFESLSDAEKEAFYQECERIGPGSADMPLTAAQRRLHKRASRRGRPRVGKGASVVSLSVEKDLLKQADELSQTLGLSRSELFSRAIRGMLVMTATLH